MEKSESIKNLAAALVKIQGEIKVVAHDAKNPFYKSEYASLGAVISATKPIMQKYGVSIHQLTASNVTGVGIETILMHESGEYISNEITVDLPQGSKKPGEEAGKIITYLRRYSWASALGLYSGDDDDLHSMYHKEKTLVNQAKSLVNRSWTQEQLQAVVNAGHAQHANHAKNMLDKSCMPVEAPGAHVVSWTKYYRAERDQGKDSENARMFADAKYLEAKKGVK